MEKEKDDDILMLDVDEFFKGKDINVDVNKTSVNKERNNGKGNNNRK